MFILLLSYQVTKVINISVIAKFSPSNFLKKWLKPS
jgi:hypothetical protein